MSGPIVRSGPTKKFSDNWESVFGKKQPSPEEAEEAAQGEKRDETDSKREEQSAG